jgi:hypothetical protein
MEIPGFGPLLASAFVASIADPTSQEFKPVVRESNPAPFGADSSQGATFLADLCFSA